MQLSKNRLLCVWLCSAAVVSLARVFNTADLGYELPTQIQAAQQFLAGKGVSIYSLAGDDDLAKPASLCALTHFPAGYSFYAAALIAMDASLATIVKLYGATGTIVGWLGWGALAWSFFNPGLQRGSLWRWIACAAALFTPLQFTPPWQDTDILFWAITPWILLCVVRAASDDFPSLRWFDVAAGVLCGVSLLLRHAGLFFVFYAAFLIICQSGSRLKLLLARMAAFAAGLLPFVALQVYSRCISPAESALDVVRPAGLRTVAERLWEGLWLLPTANFAATWWMPHQLLNFFTATRQHVAGLLCLTLAGWIMLLPIFAKRIGYRGLITASRDVRLAAAGLFVSLPLFLWVWTAFADYLYVGDERYYIPLLPLFVLIVYALAVPDPDHSSKMEKWIRRIGLGYLVAYVCSAAISVALLPKPGEAGLGRRVKLMGTPQIHHWPSMKMAYEFWPARNYVADFLKKNPETVLVTNHEEWFYPDPGIDQSRVRRLKGLRATYVSGPAHILIAVQDYSVGPLQSVSWFEHYGQVRRGDYFRNLPEIRLLKKFPEENVKVLESRIPEGTRIALNKESAEVEMK
ncbi:MAG: hypothetical protein QOG67_800 [Verrucomicrobiota bacterium]|jgi:hypothetical protein